jgi:hypothetical protein
MEFTPEELATEIWRDISIDFPNYSISNLGRIKIKAHSTIRNNGWPLTVKEKIRKLSIVTGRRDCQKSVHVSLSGTKGVLKSLSVARLVLETFDRPDKKGEAPIYLDHDSTNIRATNLKWASVSSAIKRKYLINPQPESVNRGIFSPWPIDLYDSKGKLIESFISLKKAQDKYGTWAHSIKEAAIKGTPIQYGSKNYYWCRQGDTPKMTSHGLKKEVLQYTKYGEFITSFPSVREAARQTGISSVCIRRACRNAIAPDRRGGTYTVLSAGGYKWKHADDTTPINTNFHNVPVEVIDPKTNDVVYSDTSIIKAAKFMGCNPKAVGDCVAGKLKTSGGYLWRKIKDFSILTNKVPSPSKIHSFFIGKKWPYHTHGKSENTEAMIEFMQQQGLGESSFLSMPNIGRELHFMKEYGLIHIPTSVGVEMDPTLFSSMLIAFRRLFPGLKLEKDNINEYVKRMQQQFDIAHLDYCGPLIKSNFEALNRVASDGTLSFITVQDNDYYRNRFKGKGLENEVNIQEIYNNFHVVYDNKYNGIKQVPMITLGVIK